MSIPFILEENRIILDAVINDKSGRFIFDSGIIDSYVNIKSFSLFPVAYTKRIYKNKLRTVLVYGLNKIYFGDMEVKANSWIINHDDIIDYLKEEEGYDGLLGMRIFEGYWCEISFPNQEIILHKEKPKKEYKYHSPLKTFSKYDSFYLPIMVDNIEILMHVDTGLRYGALFPNDIINSKNDNEIKSIISIEEVKNYYLVETKSIVILDETYKNKYIMTNSYSAQRRNYTSHNDIGLIGINILKYYDLLFDYTEVKKGKTSGMYYQPLIPLSDRNYGFFSFLDEVPEFGILNFWLSETRLIIMSILEDSIAYNLFNLRPGMIITKINDNPISVFSREELLDPLFYHSVKSYSLHIDNEEKTIFIN